MLLGGQEPVEGRSTHLFNPTTTHLDTFPLITWLRKAWNNVDARGRNKLDLDEVTSVFKKLNISLSKSELKSAFKVRKGGMYS